MADTTSQPRANKSIFGEKKRATHIRYQLIHENKRTRPDTPKYPPYLRMPNTDTIAWPYDSNGKPLPFDRAINITQTDENYEFRNRGIRLLQGEKSIFVDEQEANGRQIPKAALDNPNSRIEIIDGEIRVRPADTARQQYLNICNENRDSPFGTGKRMQKFFRYNGAATDKLRLANEELKEKAIRLSREVEDQTMVKMVHALNIQLEDDYTGETRTDDAIKADFFQVASDDPKRFIETFDKVGGKMKVVVEGPTVPKV